jgi:hypothetical protein
MVLQYSMRIFASCAIRAWKGYVGEDVELCVDNKKGHPNVEMTNRRKYFSLKEKNLSFEMAKLSVWVVKVNTLELEVIEKEGERVVEMI